MWGRNKEPLHALRATVHNILYGLIGTFTLVPDIGKSFPHADDRWRSPFGDHSAPLYVGRPSFASHSTRDRLSCRGLEILGIEMDEGRGNS